MGGIPHPEAARAIVSAMTEAVSVDGVAVDELRAALAFYADRQNWMSPSTGFAAQYDPEPSLVKADWGAIARRALGRPE